MTTRKPEKNAATFEHKPRLDAVYTKDFARDGATGANVSYGNTPGTVGAKIVEDNRDDLP